MWCQEPDTWWTPDESTQLATGWSDRIEVQGGRLWLQAHVTWMCHLTGVHHECVRYEPRGEVRGQQRGRIRMFGPPTHVASLCPLALFMADPRCSIAILGWIVVGPDRPTSYPTESSLWPADEEGKRLNLVHRWFRSVCECEPKMGSS